MKHIRTNTWLLFAFSLYCFLVLIRALNMDMFFDGVIYASISQNIALDKGSFWHLYYTDNFLNPFYEHPPLAMWLQSLVFRVFGTSWRIELIWGFLCGLITLVFIKKIYDEYNNQYSRSLSWWPIILFISIPTVTWTFANNLLENTMIVFTTGAVLYSIKALRAEQKNLSYFYSVASGLLVFLAFMSKGLPGLFPLAVPFIWLLINWGENEKAKNSLKVFSRMLLYMFFCGVLLNVLSSGELFHFFSTYFNQQVSKSILGEREEIRRFYLTYRFIAEIIVPVLIALVTYTIFKFKKITAIKDKEQNRTALFFFLIALSASLPMFFIPKQRIWYLFPSFVFYTMAIAKLSEHRISLFKQSKTIGLISIILLITALLSITVFGGTRFKRDKDLYKDILSQKELIPPRSILYVCPKEMADRWELTAYLQRFCLSGMSSNNINKSSELILVDRLSKEKCELPKNVSLINKDPKRYELYR